MCKLKSGIILKSSVFLPDYDSHETMLEELGIEDNYLNASKTFVRAELSPKDGDAFSDIDTWELNVDQDVIPDWFNEEEYKPLMMDAVKKWAESHIHIDADGLQISSGRNHHVKNCRGVMISGSASVERICGSARVERICGSARVENICGSASVERICGSARVERICGSARVENICDSARVGGIFDSAKVGGICDSARVGGIFGSARVGSIFGSARVENICGFASVGGICDSASVERICDYVRVENICGFARIGVAAGHAFISTSKKSNWDNASILRLAENATFKDNYNNVLYQAGAYQLVNVQQNN